MHVQSSSNIGKVLHTFSHGQTLVVGRRTSCRKTLGFNAVQRHDITQTSGILDFLVETNCIGTERAF